MIQDIAPHKLNNVYDPSAAPHKGDALVFYRDGGMFVKTGEGQLLFPEAEGGEEGLTFLFRLDERAFFLTDQKPEGYELISMRELRAWGLQPKELVFAAFTAMHLAEWYRKSRFCGCCGGLLEKSGTERAMVCPECKATFYPRLNPAVIVGVKNKDSLLVTKYNRGFSQNALIAGFAEIGETLEETVAREVMEETGVRVKNITYYKSQPWGVAGDLLAGFLCEVDGDTKIRRDENELKEAAWVERENIVLQTSDYSLTNEIMSRFKNGLW